MLLSAELENPQALTIGSEKIEISLPRLNEYSIAGAIAIRRASAVTAMVARYNATNRLVSKF